MLDYNVPGGKLNRGMAVGDILHSVTKDVRLLNRTHSRPCACLLFLPSMTQTENSSSVPPPLLYLCPSLLCLALPLTAVTHAGEPAADLRGECARLVHRMGEPQKQVPFARACLHSLQACLGLLA